MARTRITEMSGHKTCSVFDRSNIVNSADLIEGSERLEQGARLGASLSGHRLT